MAINEKYNGQDCECARDIDADVSKYKESIEAISQSLSFDSSSTECTSSSTTYIYTSVSGNETKKDHTCKKHELTYDTAASVQKPTCFTCCSIRSVKPSCTFIGRVSEISSCLNGPQIISNIAFVLPGGAVLLSS